MKLISYSLFGANNFNEENRFEFRSYLRGFYWNVRMNHLLYPGWKTNVELDEVTYVAYQGLFDWLKANYGLVINLNCKNTQVDPLCKAMLWRLKPLFREGVTHVLCRDSDSITTYREAQCVQLWLESNLAAHAINDNPAHGGLMGGMVGFDSAKFKAITEADTWDELLTKDISFNYQVRGTDQDFMNKFILPRIKYDLFFHALDKVKLPEAHTVTSYVRNIEVPEVNPKLWESNLTCRHIGSAGVVEMELLRFFSRFSDEGGQRHKEIEMEYPEIFYWRLRR